MSLPDNFDPLNNNKKQANHKKLFSWISPNHRLVIINDESFKEEKSIALNAKNVLIFLVITIAILILSVLLALRFFGGKGSSAIDISNYSPDDVRHQLIIIHQHLDSLNQEIADRDIYIEQISRILNNNLETEKDIQQKQKESKALAEENTANPSLRNEKMPEKSEVVSKMMETSEADYQAANLVLSNDFDSNVKIEQLKFVSPLRGIISDTFAASRKHYGIDIVAPKGSVIKSTQSGTVIVATWSADTGHMIGIQHANNVVSFYKHNSSLLKKQGDKVQAGEAIAIIGNTGAMTEGPHLHFELWYYGQAVDPKKYIEF